MKTILPGATIGVLGSGQLGRMFAIAARRMGYRVHTFSPDEDTPTGQIADLEVQASYDDTEKVREWARGVDVVTFEFENVPASAVEACASQVPVHPRGEVLYITQNRLREKNWLSQNGFPVAPFRHIKASGEVAAAVEEIGMPCVLKTAGFGYDGKGQNKIQAPEDVAIATTNLGEQEGVLESWISFEREVSVVAARGQDGSFAHFGVVENRHVNHILDLTIAPAEVPAEVAQEAVEIARAVLEKLDVVGVLCVEFFLTSSGDLLINELAPRPHNSGHFSFDANLTSQFEQQLRAVCGLPLGSTEQLRPAAMANLLGDVWENGEPDWARAAAMPNVKIHLYGKLEARPGRKMGHLTALGQSTSEAVESVLAAREALQE
jgi:5-(carboxyamino)imidazole ribonucleotide synthase